METKGLEAFRSGSILADHRSNKGVQNALFTLFGFVGDSGAASSILASPGRSGRSRGPGLRGYGTGMRLWLLLLLSVRVRALWLLWAAMVRGRCVHRRRAVVSRLLRAGLGLSGWVWLLRTRVERLLRSRLLQARCLRVLSRRRSWLWRLRTRIGGRRLPWWWWTPLSGSNELAEKRLAANAVSRFAFQEIPALESTS